MCVRWGSEVEIMYVVYFQASKIVRDASRQRVKSGFEPVAVRVTLLADAMQVRGRGF